MKLTKIILLFLILTTLIITNLDEIYVVNGQIIYNEICTEKPVKYKASGAIVVDGLTHNFSYKTRIYQGTCEQFYFEKREGGD